jgi:thiol-disulfide isomerase/thioredoxin
MSNTNTNKAARIIELAANIGIVFVAVVALVFFVRSYWIPSATQHALVGEKLPLKDVNWQVNKKTLVLVLSTCHFCSESAPFYRQLARKSEEQHVRTIAVFPQAAAEALSYLKNQEVPVNEVRQSQLPDMQVTRTPTLLLIDEKGIVKGAWIGKLSLDREKEVLAKL